VQCYAGMVLAIITIPLTQVGVLLRRLNLGWCTQRCMIVQGL